MTVATVCSYRGELTTTRYQQILANLAGVQATPSECVMAPDVDLVRFLNSFAKW